MDATTGALKPFIVQWVNHGIACLKTPEFRETIKTAFKNDGLFETIRSLAKEEVAGYENNVTSFDLTAIQDIITAGVEADQDDDAVEIIGYYSDDDNDYENDGEIDDIDD